MTKISKKAAYPIKKPVKRDYFVGTDSENLGKTVNFNFEDATAVINELNGQSVIGYQFKTSYNIPLSVLEEAEFYSLGNETTISDITKLYVNKFTKNSLNLSNLYNYLLVNSGDFLFKLQGTDSNVYVYFNLASVENHSSHYVFNVSLYKGNAVLPELINFGEYFFNFELKSTGGGVGTDIIDRIVALENQTDVDNVFITIPAYSYADNLLIIMAGGKWKIDGIIYENLVDVQFYIPFCDAEKTRLEYFVPNAFNGFTRVSGPQKIGMAIAPLLPIKDFYYTYFLVTDSSVSEPAIPSLTKTPSLEDVIRTNPYSTLSLSVQEKLLDLDNNSGISINPRHIGLWNWIGEVTKYVRIKWDNIGVNTIYQIPSKPDNSIQTFAMVSDIPEAQDLTPLQNQINAINILLASDNINLDNVQELVDAIETLQTSLATILVNDLTTGGTTKALTAQMGVTIKGLIDALALLVADKVDKVTGKSLILDTEITRLATVVNYVEPPTAAIITTTASITSATLTDAGHTQNGKIIKIDNGANVINYTVNGLTASFVKGGTGAITFVQGAGRTLTGANGTLVFNGAVNSSASIVSNGTVDVLYINNL